MFGIRIIHIYTSDCKLYVTVRYYSSFYWSRKFLEPVFARGAGGPAERKTVHLYLANAINVILVLYKRHLGGIQYLQLQGISVDRT